jgi:hypothetical protein
MRVPQFALPNRDDPPACRFELSGLPNVPLHVGGELRLPELSICLGHRWLAERASVPEAPVDEDRNPSSGIGDVGTAGGLLPMKSVSGIPGLTQKTPQLQLWTSIL